MHSVSVAELRNSRPETMAHDGETHHQAMALALEDASKPESPPDLAPDAPVADVIRAAFWTAQQRIREQDPRARLGEVEGVHRMRTATRRLRSELRMYRDLLELDWSEHLGEELKWLGRKLGAVRDGDVMRTRLRTAAGTLAVDLAPLFDTLDERHVSASGELSEALDSQRYQNLLEMLAEAADRPSISDDAWEDRSDVLPALARKAWKRLHSAARALDLEDSAEDYHEVRKRAKRARYNAESVAPALEGCARDDARRFSRRASDVQDVLGEHQDAVVAGDEIRRIAAAYSSEGAFNLAAGQLLERQAVAARAARKRFFKIWQKLDRKKNVRWMKD